MRPTTEVLVLVQVGDGGLDAIIVPTSGGGMLAGVAQAVVAAGGAAEEGRPKVFAVEPQGKVRGYPRHQRRNKYCETWSSLSCRQV